jgi:hypothetical protein
VPRTNSPQSTTTNRTRSRGPARSTTDAPEPNTLDAASDRSGSSAASNNAAYDPTYDEIAEAAYQRYLQRGGADGRDFDDWVEAERELKSRRNAN